MVDKSLNQDAAPLVGSFRFRSVAAEPHAEVKVEVKRVVQWVGLAA